MQAGECFENDILLNVTISSDINRKTPNHRGTWSCPYYLIPITGKKYYVG